MQVIEIDGDGNCMYRCVSKFFEMFYSETESYSDIRDNAIAELTNFEQEYHDFIDYDKYLSYNNYLEIHSEDNVWGDNLSLRAISQSYQININVYSLDAPVINFTVEQSKYDSICNLLYVNNNHYNLIFGHHKDEIGRGPVFDDSDIMKTEEDLPLPFSKRYREKLTEEPISNYLNLDDIPYSLYSENFSGNPINLDDIPYADSNNTFPKSVKSVRFITSYDSPTKQFISFVKKQKKLNVYETMDQIDILGLDLETATRTIYKNFCFKSVSYILPEKYIRFLQEISASELGILKGLDDSLDDNWFEPSDEEVNLGLLSLYENDLVSEETFLLYWPTDDLPRYCKSFMKWLRNAEEEDEL